MPQIPQHILERPARLLYMTPLALGDFLYQSGFLRQIKEQYPQLTIDIWFDDLRKRSKSWHQGRNRILGQWLETVDYIDQTYPIPATATEREAATKKAVTQGYDAVFFVAKSRIARYEKYARRICPDGFIAAVEASKDQLKRLLFGAKPDLLLPMEEFSFSEGAHVSDMYAHFFQQVFSLENKLVKPVLEIPERWQAKVDGQFGSMQAQGRKLVLINYLSTNRSHDLDLDAVFALTKEMHSLQPQLDFILCVPPHELKQTEEACSSIDGQLKGRVSAFTAQEHFFELPALVACCDFSLSVDTSVMHFASALERPLVALMRSNNRQWRPLDSSSTSVVYAAGKDWVKDIPQSTIIAACQEQGFFSNG